MTIEYTARDVLRCLNYLGYYHITSQQLKEFMIDLKCLIRHEEKLEKERLEKERLEQELEVERLAREMNSPSSISKCRPDIRKSPAKKSTAKKKSRDSSVSSRKCSKDTLTNRNKDDRKQSIFTRNILEPLTKQQNENTMTAFNTMDSLNQPDLSTKLGRDNYSNCHNKDRIQQVFFHKNRHTMTAISKDNLAPTTKDSKNTIGSSVFSQDSLEPTNKPNKNFTTPLVFSREMLESVIKASSIFTPDSLEPTKNNSKTTLFSKDSLEPTHPNSKTSVFSRDSLEPPSRHSKKTIFSRDSLDTKTIYRKNSQFDQDSKTVSCANTLIQTDRTESMHKHKKHNDKATQYSVNNLRTAQIVQENQNGIEPTTVDEYEELVQSQNIISVDILFKRNRNTKQRHTNELSVEPELKSKPVEKPKIETKTTKPKTTIKPKTSSKPKIQRMHELKPKSSVIRMKKPVTIIRTDPVTLYQQYQKMWSQQKIPGESNHADLRWAVRERMLGDFY